MFILLPSFPPSLLSSLLLGGYVRAAHAEQDMEEEIRTRDNMVGREGGREGGEDCIPLLLFIYLIIYLS